MAQLEWLRQRFDQAGTDSATQLNCRFVVFL
jgi:hypothetical protein